MEHAVHELHAMQAEIPAELPLAREALIELLTHGRRPRVAAVGRRGAAKSSLLNALAGEPRAALGDVQDATRTVCWSPVGWGVTEVLYADTPGLRAPGRSARLQEVARSLAVVPPDVLLVLCHATEVDAGIDDDLSDVEALLAAIERASGRVPAVVAVVTRVDELDPPDVMQPPYEDSEKQRNITRSVAVMRSHLERHGIAPRCVVPIATYMRFDHGVLCEDARWNIDRLVREVCGYLPDPLERVDAAGRDARRLLTLMMDTLVEALARRALRARRGVDDERELARIRDALVRWSAGLAPHPSRAGTARSITLRGGVMLEGARNILAAVGSTRWRGVTEAARVRTMGKRLRDRVLAEVALADFAALATVSGAP